MASFASLDRGEPQRLSTPKLLVALAIGVLAGSIFWAGIRTSYYLFFDIRPQMSPMMFVVFAPVVAVVVSCPRR